MRKTDMIMGGLMALLLTLVGSGCLAIGEPEGEGGRGEVGDAVLLPDEDPDGEADNEDLDNEEEAEARRVACDRLLSQGGFELPGDLPVLYVDAAAGVGGDGTQEAPFQSIQEALAAVAATPVKIHVALGEYEGGFNLPSGVQLVGGFTSETWERNGVSVIRNRTESLDIIEGEDGQIALLEGFDIYGDPDSSSTLWIGPGARAVVRNNRIFTNLGEVTWQTYGDTHVGVGLESNEALLELSGNEILVPSDTPEHVISTGLGLADTCAIVRGNRIDSVRTSISVTGGEAVIDDNQIVRAFNGIAIDSASPVITGNSIESVEPDAGCVYLVYMEGESHPVIRDNELISHGCRARGINETGSLDADPAELVNNLFRIRDCGTPLYMDADGEPDEGMVNRSLTSIDEVNGLSDIPVVGGNSLEMIP